MTIHLMSRALNVWRRSLSNNRFSNARTTGAGAMILLSVLFWTAFSLPPSAAESTNSCPNIISLSTAEGLSICGGGGNSPLA